MEVDPEDQVVIEELWEQFEDRLYKATDKVCYQFFKKMERKMTHVLGYRGRHPEDEQLRYHDFLAWVDEVYLKPSLYDGDGTGSTRSG